MKQIRNKNKKGYFLDFVAFTIVLYILTVLVFTWSARIKMPKPSESNGSVKVNCDSPAWKKKPICN